MWCTRLTAYTGRKKIAKNRHLGTIAQLCPAISLQLRHVLTIRKKLLNSNISSTCPHNVVIVGPLTAEIRWRVWGTPANFNRFHVLALGFVTAPTLLNGGQQNFAGCLAVSRAGTLYIHFWAFPPLTEFCCKIHFASTSCILLYWQHYCTALKQRPSAKLFGMVQGMELRNFRKGHHLYLAWRPSRWALARILVIIVIRLMGVF